MTAYLQIGDYIALIGYFVVVIGIGIWVIKNEKFSQYISGL